MITGGKINETTMMVILAMAPCSPAATWVRWYGRIRDE